MQQAKEKSLKLLKNWTEETTFHAIPYLVRPINIFFKLFWLIIFLAALSFTAYAIIYQISEFYAYNTLNTIELIDPPLLSFPSITLCNINPFASISALEFVSKDINSTVLSSLESDYFGTAVALSYSKRAELLKSGMNDTFRRSMGLTKDYFILTCYYNGKQCDMEKDFAWYYDTEYGNCFTFASNKSPKMVTKVGQDNGLIVSLFVGLPDSILTLDFFRGANIFVHDPESKPARYQSIQIAAGFSNSIGINKVAYQRLGQPYSNCVDKYSNATYDLANQTLVRATLAYNGVYNQAICFEYCYQYYIWNKCGCLEINIEPAVGLDSSKMCSSIGEIICSHEGFVEFYEQANSKIECTRMCPEECVINNFEMQHSFTQYSENFKNYLAKNPKVKSLTSLLYNVSQIDLELTKNSISTLFIYYNRLTYDFYQEVPQLGINDLLSRIGGVLGLLLGGSLLSVVEVLFLIFQILVNLIPRSPNRQTVYI